MGQTFRTDEPLALEVEFVGFQLFFDHKLAYSVLIVEVFHLLNIAAVSVYSIDLTARVTTVKFSGDFSIT